MIKKITVLLIVLLCFSAVACVKTRGENKQLESSVNHTQENVDIVMTQAEDNVLCLSGFGPSYLLDYKGKYVIYMKGNDVALVKGPESWGLNSVFDVIKKEDIRRDEYGFPVATFFGRDAQFLLGGAYAVFRFLDEKESGMVYLPETCRYLIENLYHDIYPSGVEVSCSSYLTEGAKQYTAANLTKTFIGVLRDGGMVFNTVALPWVEGEAGSGIGVILSIQFKTGSLIADRYGALDGMYDSISIMNGYVDFYRPDLFFKNNRVKTVNIKSTDNGPFFEFEYELKDVPEFQGIPLPRKSSSVDITIKEVYKGNLYDDTAITSILPVGQNWTESIDIYDRIYQDPHFKNWKELPEGSYNLREIEATR